MIYSTRQGSQDQPPKPTPNRLLVGREPIGDRGDNLSAGHNLATNSDILPDMTVLVDRNGNGNRDLSEVRGYLVVALGTYRKSDCRSEDLSEARRSSRLPISPQNDKEATGSPGGPLQKCGMGAARRASRYKMTGWAHFNLRSPRSFVADGRSVSAHPAIL